MKCNYSAVLALSFVVLFSGCISVPYCGNDVCDKGETAITCQQDCGLAVVCGNDVCDKGETAITCQQDCRTSHFLRSQDVLNLLNKAAYRNNPGVGSTISCNEYCNSFGEVCILAQFTNDDPSPYESEVVRCAFKEQERITNCVCTKPN